MTPAEELRAAVKVLRCEHSFPVLPPLGSIAHPGDCEKCGVAWGHHKLVANGLAEPLAVLLDDFADMLDEFADLGDKALPLAEKALPVARVILGGAP